jgi:hypothetical protein
MRYLDDLRAYGRTLIETADREQAAAAAHRAVQQHPLPGAFRRRVLAVAASVATFITGNVGLAMAADSAVPGDTLYGIDRAYEHVSDFFGFGGDRVDERLAEVEVLIERGNNVDALERVLVQLGELHEKTGAPGLTRAREAILAALDRMEARDLPPGQEKKLTESEETEELADLAKQIADAARANDFDRLKELTDQANDHARGPQADSPGLGPDDNPGLGPDDNPGQDKVKDKEVKDKEDKDKEDEDG